MERFKRIRCTTKNCRNNAAPQRTICEKCKSRLLKQKNPYLYYYNNLRNNARRRGKKFSLSFDEFKKFCDETGYLLLKGKNAGDASIDRIKDNEGYSYNNIRMITLSHNSYKNATGREPDNDNCPY